MRAALLPTAKWAPATPQVIRVCLNNVWLYFYISALWNPVLYKRQWRGVPAAFGWCCCSPNDRTGAGTSRVTRPLLYSSGSQFSCVPCRLSCQAWGTHRVPLTWLLARNPQSFAIQGKLQGREAGVLPTIPHQILTRKCCFPCSVHSHAPGIHHTEVSSDGTCLFKTLLDMCTSAIGLTARLFHYFSSQF